MPAAISLYVYRMQIYEDRGRKPLSFDDHLISIEVFEFLANFVKDHRRLQEDHDRQRTWFFDRPRRSKGEEVAGLLRYGVFGFESELIDTRTKKKQYDRKSTDFEQIELYYQFWCPDGEDFALLAFQSFSGRSCVGYVFEALKSEFRKTNKNLTLRLEKIAPQIINKATFGNAQVKQITLSKRSASKDLSDLHGASKKPQEVEVEVKVTAKSGTFGRYRDLNQASLKHDAGLYTIGASPFQKAKAKVSLNGKTRSVGIFGDNGNAGAFDITEDVDFSTSGHPKFASIDTIADDILSDTCEVLT